MAAKKYSTGSKRKIVIFIVEIIIILIMVGALWVIMSHTDQEGEGPKVTVLEKEELAIPQEIVQEKEEGGTMKGYLNIALFGVDNGEAIRETKEKSTGKVVLTDKGYRSDTIMIASINMDTGDIKLVSVYRDTYLKLGEYTQTFTDDSGKTQTRVIENEFNKCNKAFSVGGAKQAVAMLNMNLDMDIENFVAVGYKGVIEVVDGLGGVYIEVDSEELKHINNYQISIAEELGCDYKPVTDTGLQLLNGLQATAYCRIRYTKGDDFKRATRQREVIKAIEEQAKKADYAKLSKIFNNAIGEIYTSLDSATILDLIANIANYRIVDEGGFPEESMRTTGNIGAKGSCVVPVSLEDNVVWLHQFLFEDEDYKVTESVAEYSTQVQRDTTEYLEKIN